MIIFNLFSLAYRLKPEMTDAKGQGSNPGAFGLFSANISILIIKRKESQHDNKRGYPSLEALRLTEA